MPTDIHSIPLEIIHRIITAGCDDPEDQNSDPLNYRQPKPFAKLSKKVCRQWRNIVYDPLNYHLWTIRLALTIGVTFGVEIDLVQQIAEFKNRLASSNNCDIIARLYLYIDTPPTNDNQNSRKDAVSLQLFQHCLLWLIPYSNQLWDLSIRTRGNTSLDHFVQVFVSKLGCCSRLRNLTIRLAGPDIDPIDPNDLIARRPFFPLQWHRIRYGPKLRFPLGDNLHTIQIYGIPHSHMLLSYNPQSVIHLTLSFPGDRRDSSSSLRRLLEMSPDITYLQLQDVFIPPAVNRDQLLPLHLPQLADMLIFDSSGGNNLSFQLLFSMISGTMLSKLFIGFIYRDEADFDDKVLLVFPRLLHLKVVVSSGSQVYASKWLSRVGMPHSCHLELQLRDSSSKTDPMKNSIPLDALDNLPMQTTIAVKNAHTCHMDLVHWTCKLTSSSTSKLFIHGSSPINFEQELTSCSASTYEVDWQNLRQLSLDSVDIDSILIPFGYPMCPQLSEVTCTLDHPWMSRPRADQAFRTLSFVRTLNLTVHRSRSSYPEWDYNVKTYSLLTFLSIVEKVVIKISGPRTILIGGNPDSLKGMPISPTIAHIVEFLDLSVERLKTLDKLQHLDISLSHRDVEPLPDDDDHSWQSLTAMVEEFARWREGVGNPLKHVETHLDIRR